MTESFIQSMFRHPRRMGFITFNVIAMVILVSWIIFSQNDLEDMGLFGLPFFALSYLGILFLLVAWIGSWIAWIWMVAKRRRHHGL